MPYPYIMLAYPLLTRNYWHFIKEKLEQVTDEPWVLRAYLLLRLCLLTSPSTTAVSFTYFPKFLTSFNSEKKVKQTV